jgi:hypothetical protein
MPDRRRHGAHEDRGAACPGQGARPELARPAGRLSAALCARGRAASALLNLRDRLPGAAAASERLFGLQRQTQAAALAPRQLPCACTPGHGRDVVLLADTFNRYFEPENLVPPMPCCRPPATG